MDLVRVSPDGSVRPAGHDDANTIPHDAATDPATGMVTWVITMHGGACNNNDNVNVYDPATATFTTPPVPDGMQYAVAPAWGADGRLSAVFLPAPAGCAAPGFVGSSSVGAPGYVYVLDGGTWRATGRRGFAAVTGPDGRLAVVEGNVTYDDTGPGAPAGPGRLVVYDAAGNRNVVSGGVSGISWAR